MIGPRTEPHAGEVARNEHRPQGANRVDSPSGDGAGYEDPDGQGAHARWAMAAGALESVATDTTTKTRMKVMRISTTNACKSPIPCAG